MGNAMTILSRAVRKAGQPADMLVLSAIVRNLLKDGALGGLDWLENREFGIDLKYICDIKPPLFVLKE
jgi:hypothetical protein